MLRRISLPVQLLIVIACAFLFGTMLPQVVVTWMYTASVVFKDLLTFILPFIILAFVLDGILSFKKNAPLILLIMLAMIFVSNALVTMLDYVIMRWVSCAIAAKSDAAIIAAHDLIHPAFTLGLPTLLRTEYALICAIILGLFFSFVRVPKFERSTHHFKRTIEHILNWVVIPFLPLYVFGFLLKMRFEGTFILLMQNYSGTFFLIVATQICYLIWMYALATRFSLRNMLDAIKNALPSYLTGFSTMSSAVTVPVSVECAYKNTHNRPLAMVAMPIMANVHLLGDSIGIPMLAMVTMLLFTGSLPDFAQYVSFVFYFCTAMFAVSGIPGGAILVMTPILVSQLNFSAEMIGVITALFLLMDSFGTAANVMGDGALVIMVDKLLKKLGLHNE